MQHLLIKIGRALKYEVHVARNDRHRTCHSENFAMLTVPQLPPQNWPPEVMDTVTLIDVIWLKPGSGEIVSAFEVEKSTSIYSGILRLEDLARSIPGGACPLYLVGVPFITFPPIKPGASFSYEFPIRQSGTYWYHSHTALHEQQGVYGALVLLPTSGKVTGDSDHGRMSNR